jgi:transglutaminase-like putative cysteine protease
MWVMATLALALTIQLWRMPIWLLFVTLAPFGWRLWSEKKGLKPLPTVIRVVALGVALLMLVLSYGNVFGRTAAVSLLAVMLSLKLLETYYVRDARVVVSFSMFLCATQFLFAQGVLMPLYGAVVVTTALISMAHLHRRESFIESGKAPRLGRSVFSEVGFSFRILALALPAALALFILFPRWSNPLWGVPEASLDARSGLSDSMSPGSIQQLFMDDTAAFRVEFHGPVPPQQELYWRGPVLWEFDGREWESNFWSRNIEARERPSDSNADYRYTIQLEPNERRWLFALDYPTVVPGNSRLTMDFQILRRKSVTQLFRYDMASDSDFRDSPQISQVLRQTALQLPDGLNSRSRDLITQWRQATEDDRALAERVLRFFNEEEFHYMLDAPLLGLHTVDDFLFRTRAGYCEHYASAFTVLMRMAGIPARVVTGYQGGWFNEFGDYMLVRQSDAHAWSEIWLEGEGWIRVDPTAAVSPLRVQRGSLDALSDPRHMLDFEWLRRVKNGVDVLQRTWNDWVIDFGAAEQARLFAPLGIANLGPKGLVTVLLLVLGILGILLMPLIMKIQGPLRRSPLQATWLRFLRRLERSGVSSRPSMGALTVALEAGRKLPDDAAEINRITGLYNRYRYSPSPPVFKDFKLAVKSFRPGKKQED